MMVTEWPLLELVILRPGISKEIRQPSCQKSWFIMTGICWGCFENVYREGVASVRFMVLWSRTLRMTSIFLLWIELHLCPLVPHCYLWWSPTVQGASLLPPPSSLRVVYSVNGEGGYVADVSYSGTAQVQTHLPESKTSWWLKSNIWSTSTSLSIST